MAEQVGRIEQLTSEERARRHREMTESALAACQRMRGQATLAAQHALDRARRAEQARDAAERDRDAALERLRALVEAMELHEDEGGSDESAVDLSVALAAAHTELRKRTR